MQHVPRRRGLAGSVLILGSVGAVTAVHLEAAPIPSSPGGQTAAAIEPSAPPADRPATADAGTPVLDEPAHYATTPGTRSSGRRSTPAADRPVTGRDLIDIARGPRHEVGVPAHDLDRTVPLRTTRTAGHRDVRGGAPSFNGVLRNGGPRSGDRGLGDRWTARSVDADDRGGRNLASHDLADYDRTDHDRTNLGLAVFGWADDLLESDHGRVGRRASGYHQADVRWDSSDVSYPRTRCGRHRA
ncbi:MAG TPA: hypothetical protein VIQ30_18275 [Pseudonocardia sp.]